MPVTEIKGYKILKVKIPGCVAPHHVMYKKHDMKTADGDDRSIFFCNLPISTNIQVMRKLFQKIAIGSTVQSYTASYLTESVEDVFLDLSKLTTDLDIKSDIDEASAKLPKNCGIVTFIDKPAFQLAMKGLKQCEGETKTVEWPLNPESFGTTYFMNQFHSKVLDIDVLSQDVNDALIDFDQAEKESMEGYKAQKELVDDDGFTLVVGNQRKTKAGIMGQQNIAKAAIESDKSKAKSKKKEKEDFYRFQLRERKKEEMNELLRKFKADQEKIRSMREKKRFRPY